MKFFQALIALLVILAAGTLVGLMVVKPRVDREIESLVRKTQGRNIEIHFLDYGKIRLSGTGITLNHIRVRGVTRIQHPYFDPREFDLSIKQVRLGLQSFFGKNFKAVVHISGLDAKGGRILNEDRDDHERIESVTGLDFQSGFLLEGSPFFWKAQLIKRARQVKAWAFDDQPIKDLKLKGSAVFIVEDWPVAVRFHSVTNQSGLVHIEGNAEDLRVIAEMIEPKFTDTDLNLAAKNLLKTPRLLNIRTRAEMQAVKLQKRDPEIAYDVARHIFWSYWLTQAYGAGFAREATDAHEIGDELNSAAESEKDRHHNALGIEYAGKHLTEAQVEKIIFTDPRIIRLKKKPVRKAALSRLSESSSQTL